jgi:hypothetical protein
MAPQPTKHEVVDGVYAIPFLGASIGFSTTGKLIPQPSLRWVEMELYTVEPGQSYSLPDDPDQEDLLKLPDGGYLCHVIGQSVVYHQYGVGCGGGGVPTTAKDTEIDVLPCPDCRPVRLWTPARDGQAWLRPGVDPEMQVELETARHSVQRATSEGQIVRSIVGSRLSTPAQKLLYAARKNDPRIDAYLAGRPIV